MIFSPMENHPEMCEEKNDHENINKWQFKSANEIKFEETEEYIKRKGCKQLTGLSINW